MCLNEICRDLTAVNETVSEWSAGAPVSEIEKDVVLEKLRAVYSQIKSVEVGENWPECATEVVADEPDTVPCETADALSDAVKKRKALLSLYDQRTVEHEETPAELTAHSAKTERHAPVLGEVMNACEQTLGEAYAQQHSKHHNISSEISSGHVKTLGGAIGINDKFLMIRDMFDDDAAAYEAAMQTFESFHDLDDAMVYIYENFNWDPNCAGVTMLVDLLTRKLA